MKLDFSRLHKIGFGLITIVGILSAIFLPMPYHRYIGFVVIILFGMYLFIVHKFQSEITKILSSIDEFLQKGTKPEIKSNISLKEAQQASDLARNIFIQHNLAKKDLREAQNMIENDEISRTPLEDSKTIEGFFVYIRIDAREKKSQSTIHPVEMQLIVQSLFVKVREIISAQKGILDEYRRDGIYVAFPGGMGETLLDTAISLTNILEQINFTPESPFRFTSCIAIEYGEMVVGNMESIRTIRSRLAKNLQLMAGIHVGGKVVPFVLSDTAAINMRNCVHYDILNLGFQNLSRTDNESVKIHSAIRKATI